MSEQLNALKQALEALKHCVDAITERGLNGNPEFAEKWGLKLPVDRASDAITAIKQALAAPAQEPVANDTKSILLRMAMALEVVSSDWRISDPTLRIDIANMLTTPPAAQPAPVQEPVKFLANGTRFKTSVFPYGVCINGLPKELSGRWVALVAAEDDCHLRHTTPPAAQRQWVGLELHEIRHLSFRSDQDYMATRDQEFRPNWNDLFARAIEAKLKEKNAGETK